MKKNPWITLLILFVLFGSIGAYFLYSSVSSFFGVGEKIVKVSSRHSILHLELDGIIMDGKKFLKNLKEYRKNDRIKAIVISINSPGGVVGPSQEIYEEIKRAREDFGKPVVVHSAGLMASGAYYAAVAGDRIIVAPGTMMGSIGVIMEFMNLEKLYDWAKVNRYTITTGKYKDSGAEYRMMRDDEKALFQELVNDVWEQFKEAVATGRNLDPVFVNQYADGRVFTGAQGVKLGFADEFGTLDDAYDTAAELAGLGDDYDVFEVPKRHSSILDFISAAEDDEVTSQVSGKIASMTGAPTDAILSKILHVQLMNKPLYLMPGSFE